MWPLSPLGHGSCTKLMVARAPWASGHQRLHGFTEVKVDAMKSSLREFCAVVVFTWFHMLYSHARWLYLIAARAEDLPMPEGFVLLPNTRHEIPCMHFYLYTCWYVCMHLSIPLPTHLCDYSLTYLLPIHLLENLLRCFFV